MFVRVAIDPFAADEMAEGVARKPSGRVIRWLREQVLLGFESKEARAALLQAFDARAVGVELASAFQALLQADYRHLYPRDNPPVPMEQLDSALAAQSWAAVVDLLLLSETRSADLGGAATRPELTTFRDTLNSIAFDRSDQQRQRTYPRGTPRNVIWREVFQPLAERSVEIYLIDRFFASQLVQALRARDRGEDRPANGAEWFVRNLAKTPRAAGAGTGTKVTIVSSDKDFRDQPDGAEKARARIATWTDGLRPACDVSLRIRPDPRVPHDRHVAFVPWVGLQLGNGVASFDEKQLKAPLQLDASPSLSKLVISECDRLR